MLVKAQTFTTKSHHATAVSRRAYLQKDGREVALGTRNVVDESRWAEEIDRTRKQYHLRGNVVGREYVLSPSPEDHATPAQMLSYGLEFAGRFFPGCEAAVVVHTDNRERLEQGKEPIAHAHVYVSSVDLDTGKKVQLSKSAVREIHDVAQEMAAARGWSAQEAYWDKESQQVRYLTSARSEYERRPKWQRLEERRNPEYEKSSVKEKVSRYEFEQRHAGKELDRTYLRRALKESVAEVAANPGVNIAQAMWSRGVITSKAADGDLKYRRQGSELEFKGATLGEKYSKENIDLTIKEERENVLSKENDHSESNGLSI